MTQEDKTLLLKDLCGRLPYGVKVDIPDLFDSTKNNIEILNEIFCGDDDEFRCNDSGILIKHVKPYLFPLSSMTEEQHEELFTHVHNAEMNEIVSSGDYLKAAYIGENTKRDWLLKKHFDCMGLIPKDLAIDATGKGIY